MAMHVIRGNVIVDGHTIVATVNENGYVHRYTNKRIAIRLLREAGANEIEIERVREIDRRHEANRRSRRQARQLESVNRFDTDRTFGIEIEVLHHTNENIASDVCGKLNSIGIPCIDQHRRSQYNHRDSETNWRLVYDGSICGEYTFELVSPILKGEEAFETIKKVCEVLNTFDCKVNASCGLHVHHYAGDLGLRRVQECFNFYKKNENLIDSIMPRTRHNGMYCGALNCISYATWQTSRYYKLNFCSLARHNTLEFRHHNGTTSATKIINWVKLTQLFLLNANRKSYSSLNELLTNIGFDNVEYYLNRAQDLAA